LQRRIERAFLDLENVFGDTLDGIGDFVAMELTGASKRFEDEEVEGTGRDFVAMQRVAP
jgi:hypothetical protein